MTFSLPFVIRPLRPAEPRGRADPDAWPRARRVLTSVFGGNGAEEFAGWLAELYWRASANAWPGDGAVSGAHASLTRCCLRPCAGGRPGAALRLAYLALATGPARTAGGGPAIESGEAVFLAKPAQGLARFDVTGAAAREDSDAADAEVPAFARWLYDEGLMRAAAAEAADFDHRVRRLVRKTCEGVDINEEEG